MSKLKLKDFDAYISNGNLWMEDIGLRLCIPLRQAKALSRWLKEELTKEQEKK